MQVNRLKLSTYPQHKKLASAILCGLLLAALLSSYTIGVKNTDAKGLEVPAAATPNIQVTYATANCVGNVYGPQANWWGYRLVFDGCAVRNLYFRQGTWIIDGALFFLKTFGGQAGKTAVDGFWSIVVPQLYQKSQQCGGKGAEWHVNWWNPFEVTKLNGC